MTTKTYPVYNTRPSRHMGTHIPTHRGESGDKEHSTHIAAESTQSLRALKDVYIHIHTGKSHMFKRTQRVKSQTW